MSKDLERQEMSWEELTRGEAGEEPAAGEERVPAEESAGEVPEQEAGGGAETAGAGKAEKEQPDKTEKKEKRDKKDEKIEELTDQLRRQMAEFDNYRKRTEKEKSAMYEVGARDIIGRILPVVDSFERGLAAIPEEDRGSAFAEGMDKIYKQLLKTLEDAGVKPIEAVGKEFNPDFHNAVMHVEDESLGENIVAEEFQKGYLYRDGVVRHSMVKVAN